MSVVQVGTQGVNSEAKTGLRATDRGFLGLELQAVGPPSEEAGCWDF